MANNNRTYEIESLFDQQTASPRVVRKSAVAPTPTPKVTVNTNATIGIGGSEGGGGGGVTNWMSPDEIQSSGLLQEINRLFLHPLGLALVIMQNDQTGEKTLQGVWDGRDDPEGFSFPPEITHDPSFIHKAQKVQRMILPEREELLGYVVQPLPEPPKPDMS